MRSGCEDFVKSIPQRRSGLLQASCAPSFSTGDRLFESFDKPQRLQLRNYPIRLFD